MRERQKKARHHIVFALSYVLLAPIRVVPVCSPFIILFLFFVRAVLEEEEEEEEEKEEFIRIQRIL